METRDRFNFHITDRKRKYREIAPQESFVDDLLNFDPTWFSY
ncbi:hypothetical protein PPTG_23140 [Phytophthora nicotianae INRA-310]|uniref:Uncharacterized protein n=1 Tax=Phytophthora nicotianae (strain INRA-310) TaxID=761204 RepID=W2Q744_PHYN3|nr:hypothetical protein PPTG_23140 [Phytophthora nicotianae INRA-310]ETN08080.1 hypothetical protein PPTG_23140 [Phytophthora nicotianae INRA-310]